MKYFSFLIFLFSFISLNAQKKQDLSYYLPQNLTYNNAIPTPESVLGFEVGEWHVSHDKLISYMKALSDASPRIVYEERGRTFEGRPLIILKITSPDNHRNLEEIRLEHVKNTEGVAVDSNAPVVVYQGFSIHGNEPSGANASLLLAYHLAAGEGEEIKNLLNNTIILLDPVLNPDGLQRFAYWANTNKSANLNTDPNDREFHEVWPGGRTNHYWFDLNRDWLPVQLPESKARIQTFRSWMPNVLTDHHEMGSNSTFFFQPGIQSRVHPLTPVKNQDLTKKIANFHAKALDKIGSLYFTEEQFDDYYYGKGSTYPDVNGAVGILFEQGSSRGHSRETVNGILTFPFTIKNQFITALSTLEASVSMRVELLEYQHAFFNNALREASKDPVKAFVFGDSKDMMKTYHLAKILQRHEIDFYRPSNEIRMNGTVFGKDQSFVIPTNQKNSRLIKAIFEKRTTFKDSLFYDISAWTFPLAFNLPYAELKSLKELGTQVTSLEKPTGLVTSKSNYAYLMEWHSYNTPKALNTMLQDGLRIKVGMQPFALNGKRYDYGTILIPVQGQKMSEENLYEMLNGVAQKSHVTINGVTTGLTEGIDLGSNQFHSLVKPRVAMIVGRGVSSYDAGEIWHLFDQRYSMHLTRIDTDYLSGTDLSKYTTIIVPNSSLKLSDSMMKKLKEWVSSGGVLIAYKNAVKWLASNQLMKLNFISPKTVNANITFEQRRNARGAQVIGGAIFEARLDRSHPINFGYTRSTLPLFRRTKIFIKPDSISYKNPIQYTNNPVLSGYISEPNLQALKKTVPFQVQPLGSGRVVAFTDNTNFRAFWLGTNKLLMNAVFFAKSM